jgi:aspartoacylase
MERAGGGKVLVVGGTHGNERNAAWLIETWKRRPELLRRSGLAVDLVIGNPAAHACGRRYVERDLNRSFEPALLADPARRELEVDRARELLERHGPAAASPCLAVLDLHSTTAAMGNCLVVYGRRPTDLALAAGLQRGLGLPVYLHEDDPRQRGFLVERWPCGVVVEVGPVPQGVVQAQICRQTSLAVEAALEVLSAARRGTLRLPDELLVHLHLASLDLPRHADGSPAAVVHPARQHRDWHPIRHGDPLFLDAEGSAIPYSPPAALAGEEVWAVFVNEAAYGEKGIALSLTRRERWPLQGAWPAALAELAGRLEADPGQPQASVACS